MEKAEIALCTVGKIIGVGLAIKEAVETVELNKEDCLEIKERALRAIAILKWLEGTKMLQDLARRDALEDLEESLRNALTLVTACQGRHVVCLFCKGRGLSKKLRRVQDDIERKVMVGVFATRLANTECPPQPPPQNDGASSSDTTFNSLLDGLTEFSLAELEDATNFFSHCNLRGIDNFCYIYKGTLKHGQLVIIKRFRKCRGLSLDKQITSELAIIAKAEHRNIVKCLGYAAWETQLFCLVQEFEQNGQLGWINWGIRAVDWSSRLQQIKGIAQGVFYLHGQGIVHMDLNPSNILLNADMNPKITDLGISKIFYGSTSPSLRITTTEELVGTMGYMAPEYIFQGLISPKTDVYAFGVILLGTIIGGMCKGDPPSAAASIEWAREVQGKNNQQWMELFDLSLFDESQLKEIKTSLDIGLRCSETDPDKRPAIAVVIDELERMKDGAGSLTSPGML